MQKVKRAAIYARVSTERQEKQNTIKSQLEDLRRFCREHGLVIVKEYVDDGWSGETLARPALDELRDDALKGFFDVVCITPRSPSEEVHLSRTRDRGIKEKRH